MCQWRRSLRIVVDCRDVCHYALENTYDLRFLFLTLTIRNCLGTELSKTLNALFDGWDKFRRRQEFLQAIVGWFRNLEVKYSRKRDDWHPHFHAILGVRQDYFYRKNIDYLSHDRLVELWQESLRVDYKPVIDIRVIKPQSDGSDALMSAVAETTKYITKVSDFIFPHNLARQDRVVLELAKAVKGRRLISYGGLLKEIHRELNKLDIEQADLIHLNGSVDQSCACAVCGSTLWLHVYKWIKELKEYVG
jgi:plasmid rolling circle replication initiator protein Rep